MQEIKNLFKKLESDRIRVTWNEKVKKLVH